MRSVLALAIATSLLVACNFAGGGGGSGDDDGTDPIDAAAVTVDASTQDARLVDAGGTTGMDGGGIPGFDGGIPGWDGGIPAFDGGIPGFDGGIPGWDGGIPGFDGGLPF